VVKVEVAFRLLGDVGAEIDGRRISLGHARQRCVLAVLLVEANRPVTVDQLVDRVWGECVPQRARGTVYSYLTRLRQVLAPAGGTRIVRQSGGYVLAVDPMAVDLHRFRRLVADARVAGADPADLFSRALALWRGEAFADLDTAWLNDVRQAVSAERLAAVLDRNDLALARGHHAGLLPELVTTATAHPLDERLAGQLMVALYRSGRQAEALDRYDKLRRRLGSELGAPSATTRRPSPTAPPGRNHRSRPSRPSRPTRCPASFRRRPRRSPAGPTRSPS
jgi:DNA-binding SARP family transcriptional activator